MNRIILFLVLSIPVYYISRKSLSRPGSHGFYRFLAWECMLWLAISNVRFWFAESFSLPQLISWICLLYAIYPVTAGFIELKKKGNADETRDDTLHGFEKTKDLVDTGIFRLIRHPLYSSLLFLTWGILLKNITFPLVIIALLSTLFLFATALAEEKENIAYFGDQYREYMKRTKMFIPWIF